MEKLGFLDYNKSKCIIKLGKSPMLVYRWEVVECLVRAKGLYCTHC